MSPWVPEETRSRSVVSRAAPFPFDEGETAEGEEPPDGIPGDAPVFFSAHPKARLARPTEAQKINVENGFIGQAPPQWINKSRNILEPPKKNKMGG